MNKTLLIPAITKTYLTKTEMAARYDVSERTVDVWRQAQLLVGFKVKGVVRFDVEASDHNLIDHGF